MNGMKLRATGRALPVKALSNDDMRQFVDTSDEWITSRTGIRQRSVTEMDNMTGTNWSRVPTTIVEMGFLSNKGDDDLMSTIEFQRNAAIGMADGIELFLMRVSE